MLLMASCAKKDKVRPAFDPEAQFSKANKLIESKRFDEAREVLNEIKTEDTTGKYAPLAQLRLADSYIKEGDELELGVEEFRRFLELYAGHKYASYAQYQIAVGYYNRVKDPERGYGAAWDALREFETLNSLYPRNPYRDSVQSAIEKCLEVLAEYEFMVGEFYFKKEAYTGALGRFLGLLERFPGSKKEAEVLYRVSASYKGLGQNDKAEEYYKLLISKYPKSKVAEKAKKEFTR